MFRLHCCHTYQTCIQFPSSIISDLFDLTSQHNECKFQYFVSEFLLKRSKEKMDFLCVNDSHWWHNHRNPRMSLREGNLSTEIFLIDMSYSPVCSVFVETHKVGTDRNCLEGSSPFLSPWLSICECGCVLQIDILFNNLFKQKAKSDSIINHFRTK